MENSILNQRKSARNDKNIGLLKKEGVALYVKENFLRFLIEAKKRTYASQGDDASVIPLLQGSKQLEFKRGDFLYRDIYFGMNYFIGQETVYYQGTAIWSMAYSGGVYKEYKPEFVSKVYTFLRNTLREVAPMYRGPEYYVEDEFSYRNSHQGDRTNFSGKKRFFFRKGTYIL